MSRKKFVQRKLLTNWFETANAQFQLESALPLSERSVFKRRPRSQHPTAHYKTETVEEFLARGGKIKT